MREEIVYNTGYNLSQTRYVLPSCITFLLSCLFAFEIASKFLVSYDNQNQTEFLKLRGNII